MADCFQQNRPLAVTHNERIDRLYKKEKHAFNINAIGHTGLKFPYNQPEVAPQPNFEW